MLLRLTLGLLIIVFCLPTTHASQKKLESAAPANLNFNFVAIPVKDVLQLIAEVGKINLVIANNIGGVITLDLKNVSWQEAFAIVLKMTGLVQKKIGSTYLVTNIRDYKQKIDEQAAMSAPKDLHFKLNHIDAHEAVAIIKSQVDLLSNQGIIICDGRNNLLWIRDDEEHLNRIRNYLLKIDVTEKQIVIEARIVNVDDHALDEIGLRLAVQATHHNSHDLNLSLPHGMPGNVGLIIAKLSGNRLIDLELTALENVGKCKIIACPKLMTQNRKPAYIESGEEIPYQEQTASGATNISFKKAVLSLKVTPYFTPDQKIQLQLEINQNKVSNLNVNGTPGIQTQQVQTQVTVNNGQTIVLGGIFECSKATIHENIPYFGSMPVVGSLFGHHQHEVSRKELLIFVTPKIVTDD